MWTTLFGVGLAAYGLWMMTTSKAIGVAPEGEDAWFFLSNRWKRLLGAAVMLAGIAFVYSGVLGNAVLD